MLKKFERCSVFPYLFFFLVFASQHMLNKPPGGITGNVVNDQITTYNRNFQGGQWTSSSL